MWLGISHTVFAALYSTCCMLYVTQCYIKYKLMYSVLVNKFLFILHCLYSNYTEIADYIIIY